MLGFPFGARFMGVGIFTGQINFLSFGNQKKKIELNGFLKIQMSKDGNTEEIFLILDFIDSRFNLI